MVTRLRVPGYALSAYQACFCASIAQRLNLLASAKLQAIVRARGKISTESRWRCHFSIIRCRPDRQVVDACGSGLVAASGNLPVVVRLITRVVSLIPVELLMVSGGGIIASPRRCLVRSRSASISHHELLDSADAEPSVPIPDRTLIERAEPLLRGKRKRRPSHGDVIFRKAKDGE